jgi:16S rRNA (guanine966-N2)-methyltransferase
MKRHSQATRRRGSVRIIAGRWRGRRVPLEPGLKIRPTPDRVRETLFNWLAPVIEGARCLDLFAGSGALGIEALSRGAQVVWFVEHSREAASRLRDALLALGAEGDRLVTGDAQQFLHGTPRAFDIVFLDAPFQGNTLENLCTLLDAGWVAPGGYVYLELSRQQNLPGLPSNWSVLRESTAGQVRFALAKRG